MVRVVDIRRKTLVAVIMMLLMLSLIGIGAAYIYIFQKGAIVVKVVDQNDKPLEGVIVQLSALAPPLMPTSSTINAKCFNSNISGKNK
ncbi:MAG: hypothetical protein ACTSXW_08195 [Candidatus Baldrarchaeia archaeon]